MHIIDNVKELLYICQQILQKLRSYEKIDDYQPIADRLLQKPSCFWQVSRLRCLRDKS